MRKLIAILLILSVLATCCGCRKAEFKMPVNFYYQAAVPVYDSENGIIAPEKREYIHLQNDIDSFLQIYFAGPLTKELSSPFPRDTKVLDWELTDGVLALNMEAGFAALTGVELTVACGCIVRTMQEVLGVDSIRISADGAELNGKPSITISGNNFSLHDDSLDRLKTTLNVYYADSDRRYLISQSVSFNAVDLTAVIYQALEKLQSPPKTPASFLLCPKEPVCWM